MSQISKGLREDDPEEVNVRRSFRVGALVLESPSLESSESIEGREDKLEESHGKLMKMFSRDHWKMKFSIPQNGFKSLANEKFELLHEVSSQNQLYQRTLDELKHERFAR